MILKTWYQVNIYPQVFGFSATPEGVIVDHPEYKWKNKKLSDYKPVLIATKAQVFKIADQLGYL